MMRRSAIFLLMGVITIMGVDESQAADTETARATFGGGCFWCTEAVYAQIKGVHSVTSGYLGGKNPNPTYQQVCTGQTGHAEAVEIE